MERLWPLQVLLLINSIHFLAHVCPQVNIGFTRCASLRRFVDLKILLVGEPVWGNYADYDTLTALRIEVVL